MLWPHHFRERRTAFVVCVQPQPGAGAAVNFDCRRVPQYLSDPPGADSDDFEQLLAVHGSQLSDRLVLHESRVTAVLSKFEERQFIHCYVPVCGGEGGSSAGCSAGAAADSCRPAQRRMLFELPRFSLEFELLVSGEQQAGEAPDDKQPPSTELRSLDYAGYCLAACQQLWEPGAPVGDAGSASAASNTLPDLTQYLVLEPAAAQQGCSAAAAPQRRLVIMPVGRAERWEGAVKIKHSDSCDADVKVSCLAVGWEGFRLKGGQAATDGLRSQLCNSVLCSQGASSLQASPHNLQPSTHASFLWSPPARGTTPPPRSPTPTLFTPASATCWRPPCTPAWFFIRVYRV